ncbi:MAG: hypothetical protein EBU52_11755, partial [Cytophagia bacterium]|nr:hypothetical protein [Cytophagia bacterium]
FIVVTIPLKATTLQNDTLLTSIYQQALRYKVSKPDLALVLLDSLLNLNHDKKNIDDLVQAMILKSEMLQYTGQFKAALQQIRQARQLATSHSLHALEGTILFNTGFAFKEINLDSSRYYYKSAYHFFEKKKDSLNLAATLTRLSHLCMVEGKFTMAMQYLNRAEQFTGKTDYVRQLHFFTNKAHNYSAVGLELASIACSRKAVALVNQHHITANDFNLSAIYGNLCNAYLNVNKADSAYYFAAASVKDLDSIPPQSPFLLSLGNIYLALDSAAQALKTFSRYEVYKNSTEYYFEKLDGLFRTYHQLKDEVKTKETAVLILSAMPEDVMKKRGWMKIYEIASTAAAYLNRQDLFYRYQQKHFEHYREIYNQANLASILEMDFEEKLKDEKIKANLEAELLMNELKFNRLRQIGLLIGALLLLIILFLLFVRYRNQKRFNSILRKKVNERTQLLTLKNEQLNEYAFINAHKLRAPVARILGLVALYELKDSGLSTTAYTNMIKQEVQSLDLIVKSISDAVEEKKVFTRADILNPQ